MVTRKVTVQLLVFVVIAVSGIVYAGGNYAGLGRLFGIQGYLVTVQLADSGGIFNNAEVTYRGVPVGRVAALRLTDDGVDVDLTIEPSAPKIPSNTKAVIADRSAVGEQYVDLEPGNGEGPYLANGSVVPQDRTTLAPAPQEVLGNLDQLARSVPTQSMRTVVDELDKAFSGTGPATQQLLDSTNSLVTTANQQLPQTLALIRDGHTVLDTQQSQADNLNSFSGGLNVIAQQLKTSDPDLRKVIESGPATAGQLDDLLRKTGNPLSTVIANFLTTTNLTTSRTSSLKELLVGLPVIGGFSDSVNQNGRGRLGVVLNMFDPPPCTRGYEGTKEHAGTDVSPSPPNTNAHCAEPSNSPIGVRGAQNVPHGDKPMVVPDSGSQQQTASPRSTAQSPAPGQLGASVNAANLAQLLGLSG